MAWLAALLSLFCFSLPFTKLFYLPKIAYKLQLPEIILLAVWILLLCSGIGRAELKKRLYSLHRLDLGVLLLLLASLLSSLAHLNWKSILDLATLTYLAGLYLAVSLIVRQLSQPLQFIKSRFLIMGNIASATVLLSLLALLAWPAIPLELSDNKYLPAYGYVQRIEAMTMSPNMLASMLYLVIFTGLFTRLNRSLFQSLNWRWALVWLASLFFTFSKSIVLVFGGVAFLLSRFPGQARWLRWFGLSAAGLVIVFYLFSSKLLLARAGAGLSQALQEQPYVSRQIKQLSPSLVLWETTYLVLDRMSLAAFTQAPLTGIGPNQFTNFLAAQQASGNYPAHLSLYNPHSLYLGTLAEKGLLGGFALLAFLSLLFQHCRQTYAQVKKETERALIWGCLLFLGVWAVESWAMDTLHFRHFWIVLGLLGGLYRAAKPTEEEKTP